MTAVADAAPLGGVPGEAPAPVVRYEEDAYGWTLQQIGHLRAGRREAIDLPHLTQVLAGLAAQERTKLKLALEQILQALLKWDHSPEARSRAWSLTIHQQRRRVVKQIRRQAGLKATVPAVTEDAYGAARAAATADLGLDEAALPPRCPYGWAEMIEREIEWLDGAS